MTTYLVVEDQTNKALLETLLPVDVLANLQWNAHAGSQAFVHAGTLLLTRAEPVVLLVDANSTDEAAIEERRRMLSSILTGYLPELDLPFEILLAVPELEVLLVFQRPVLEHLVDRPITDVEFKLAQKSPVEFLSPDLDKSRFNIDTILQKLTPDDIELIRQHPLMVALLNFLRQAVPAGE